MTEYTSEERRLLKELRRRKEPPPAPPYDEKLVAFIDILGVTDKVQESGDEAGEIMTIMMQVRSCVETECGVLIEARKIKSLQVGDGFFIVADFYRAHILGLRINDDGANYQQYGQ